MISPQRVLLDCDTGIDDALALVYLAALHLAGEIQLEAVTTTAGNTTAELAARNSQYILGLCGVDIPVAVGCTKPLVVPLVTTPETHGPDGLGYVQVPRLSTPLQSNWQSLWAQCMDAEKDSAVNAALAVIITGPATNAASFASSRGSAAQGDTEAETGSAFAGQLTLMGGAYLYPGNTTPTAEWNSWVDPHAAKEFFAAAPSPVTVCALGVTEQFRVDPSHLENYRSILGAKPEVAGALEGMLRFYFEFHEAHNEGYTAQLHDLLTCMIALRKIPFSATPANVDVEADSPLMRGTTVADYRGHWDHEFWATHGCEQKRRCSPNAHIVSTFDLQAAYAEFERALGLLVSRS